MRVMAPANEGSWAGLRKVLLGLACRSGMPGPFLSGQCCCPGTRTLWCGGTGTGTRNMAAPRYFGGIRGWGASPGRAMPPGGVRGTPWGAGLHKPSLWDPLCGAWVGGIL